MSVEVGLAADGVALTITGRDRLLCCSRGVTIPYREITAARTASWDEVRAELGWRVGGGYFPGWFATGWFLVRGRKGQRQLLAVFRDRDNLLVIDTTRSRPGRLVVAVPDAVRLAAEITARPTAGHR